MDNLRLSKEQFIYVSDRVHGQVKLKIIFEKDENKSQTRLSIFCPAFILSELEEDIIIYGNLDAAEKNNQIEKYYQLAGQS